MVDDQLGWGTISKALLVSGQQSRVPIRRVKPEQQRLFVFGQ
jgi:hypothetical protein